MTDYAYAQNIGNLKEFMKKIREIRIPTNGATINWLETLGFKSKNDRPILSIMKLIGFLDEKNKPTELWIKYRNPNYREVLAEGIKKGYKDLFDIYPDAYKRDNKELEHFFTNNSTSGKQLIDKTIRTFKTLCDLAEFNNTTDLTSDSNSNIENPTQTKNDSIITNKTSITKKGSNGTDLTINLNIQLTLPDTTDPIVYENFFASMKKYIFELG